MGVVCQFSAWWFWVMIWLNSLRPSDAYMRQWSNQHWFRQWLVVWLAPSHYQNQCWNIVNKTLRNKLLWNALSGEMPYRFRRSSIKFQGHTGQNITDLDSNWAFADYRPVAAFKSLRFALLIQWWLWNDSQSLKQHRRGALLFFKVIHQISRSHATKNCQFWPKLSITGLLLQFEFTDAFEMMHKA